MKKSAAATTVLMLVLCSGGAGAAAASLPGQAPAAETAKVVTTIRNATRFPIRIAIRPHHSREAAVMRTLQPEAVERIEGTDDLDIIFPRAGGRTTLKIDPGEPYSFRPDADGHLQLYRGSHGREDAVDLAPYVQTPMAVVDRMLALAAVSEEDVVFDIGCGDGRIVIRAAERFKAHGVGIDIVAERIAEAREAALRAGVEGLVNFRREDAMDSDLSGATVVFLYLIPESNALLRPLLEKQLAPGVRIISHAYPIPGWEGKLVSLAPVHIGLDETHYLYFYRR
jgi:SAM-dependent methyltransferase